MTDTPTTSRWAPDQLPAVKALRDDIDVAVIDQVAAGTARAVRDDGWTCIQAAFSPGDSTAYKLLLAAPTHQGVGDDRTWPYQNPGDWIVVNLGPGGGHSTWDGGPHPITSIAELSTHPHTATVITAFLSLLGTHLQEDAR